MPSTPALALAKLLPELRRVLAEEAAEDTDETALVDALRGAWPRLTTSVLKKAQEFNALFDALPPDDPLLLDETLLGILDSSERETLHTRALARLLSPFARPDDTSRRNPLAQELLEALLRIASVHPVALTAENVRVRVEHGLDGKHEGRRLDIFIEIDGPGGHVVVIENKVRANASEGQLPAYADWARKWPKRTLIFLSPAPPRVKDQSHGWEHLSYAEVAAAFRGVLAGAGEGVWSDLLRLYLGTIVQDVLMYPRTRQGLSLKDKTALLEYVRAAKGAS